MTWNWMFIGSIYYVYLHILRFYLVRQRALICWSPLVKSCLPTVPSGTRLSYGVTVSPISIRTIWKQLLQTRFHNSFLFLLPYHLKPLWRKIPIAMEKWILFLYYQWSLKVTEARMISMAMAKWLELSTTKKVLCYFAKGRTIKCWCMFICAQCINPFCW